MLKALIPGILSAILTVLIADSAQAEISPQVIEIEITSKGVLVPEHITVKQREPVILRITAHRIVRSCRCGYENNYAAGAPTDVLHGFNIMYNQIVILRADIKAVFDEDEFEIADHNMVEMYWKPQFPGELKIRCPYHNELLGTIIVKQ